MPGLGHADHLGVRTIASAALCLLLTACGSAQQGDDHLPGSPSHTDQAAAEAAVVASAPGTGTVIDGGCDALRDQLRSEDAIDSTGLTHRCFEVATDDPEVAAEAVAAWVMSLSPRYDVDTDRLPSPTPRRIAARIVYTSSSVASVMTVPEPYFQDADSGTRKRPAAKTIWVTVNVDALTGPAD